MPTLQEEVQVIDFSTDLDDELIHCVDERVNPNRSLCGRDVSDERWSDKPIDCVVCVDIMSSMFWS